MNATNHSTERRADRGNPRAEARTVTVDGLRLIYRVAGEGPVCLVHSGGPGVHPEYLRISALEEHLTMVYVDPGGSGDSDPLPDGDYSMDHSSVVYLMDKNGAFVEAFNLERSPEKAAKDLEGRL